MFDILIEIIIVIFGVAISPFMVGLVDLFCEEKDITLKSISEKKKFDPKFATITSMLLLGLFIKFNLSLEFFLFAFLTIILVMDAFADIKAQIIPNGLNFAGFLVGIVYIYFKIITNPIEGIFLLLGMFTGAGIFLFIALFAYLMYKKEGMGMGDVKLMGMLGMFFGVFNTLQIFVLSFTIGAVASIILIVTRMKKGSDYMPFGPFIVLATFTTMFAPFEILFPNYLGFINYLCNFIG